MAISDAQFLAWLKVDNNQRVTLVEQDYRYQVGPDATAVPTTGTIYASDRGYVNAAVPRLYPDYVAAVPTYSRSIDRNKLSGRYNVNVGTLEYHNADGLLDYILDLAIDGSEIRFKLGDPTWAYSDFRTIFVARSLIAVAPSADRISVHLQDTSVLLNQSIGGTVAVGGTGPNASKFRPFNFGFVHNLDLESLNVNSASLIYAHSDTGTNTAAVNVRDRGVPIGFTDNADGTVTLTASPAGMITADVLATDGTAGGGGYHAIDAVLRIVGTIAGLSASGNYYGPSAMLLLAGEVANNPHVGVSVPDKRNIIDLLDEILATINGFWFIRSNGKFAFDRLRPDALAFFQPLLGISATIVEDDIFPKAIAVSHNTPTYYSYHAFGNINQQIQSDLAGVLTPDQRALYTRKGYFTAAYKGETPNATSYLGTPSYQGGAPQLYHLTLSQAPDTLTLISTPDDTTVPFGGSTVDFYLIQWSAVRRAQMLPWIEFLDITVGMEFYALELGNIVNVIVPRFGMDNGKLFQVVTMNVMLSTMQIGLGLVRRRFSNTSVANTSSFIIQLGGLGYVDQLNLSKISKV